MEYSQHKFGFSCIVQVFFSGGEYPTNTIGTKPGEIVVVWLHGKGSHRSPLSNIPQSFVYISGGEYPTNTVSPNPGEILVAWLHGKGSQISSLKHALTN